MQIDSIAVNILVSSFISAVVGSGVTVIGFREKLSLVSLRVQQLEKDRDSDSKNAAAALLDVRRDFQALCSSLSDRANDSRTADRELFERLYRESQKSFDASERRQRYVMEVITAIARASGVTHRLSEQLLSTPPAERE